jgi:holo-[acyl-carrier protein] synthase
MEIDVGTDIVAVERIKKATARFGKNFLSRFLTQEEISRIRTIETTAGLWAAKEAVAKAVGCGIGKELSFHDILIRKDEKGAPLVIFSEKTLRHHRIRRCSLSISHDKGFAIAVAVILKESHL